MTRLAKGFLLCFALGAVARLAFKRLPRGTPSVSTIHAVRVGRLTVAQTYPVRADVALLRDYSDTFNIETTRIHDFKELAIFLRDSSGQITAGIYAFTWGGCLDIDLLWVREDLRRQGLGSRLMDAVEREGIDRGCHVAMLSTHSFQAPDFYKKRGYEEIGVLDGYPLHHKKYYLKKTLSSR